MGRACRYDSCQRNTALESLWALRKFLGHLFSLEDFGAVLDLLSPHHHYRHRRFVHPLTTSGVAGNIRGI